MNARYLALYDERRDRTKPPLNNSDLQLLRAWIQKKYIDKAWCDDKERKEHISSPKLPAPKTMSNPPSPNTSKSKAKFKIDAAKKENTPWVGSPKSNSKSDMFGFDSIISTTEPGMDTSWDAFGGSTSTQDASQSAPQPITVQANFGSMNATTPAISFAPLPAPAFQADFGNFSQPTLVSLPPLGQLSSQPQQQQVQQSLNANFCKASVDKQENQQQASGGNSLPPSCIAGMQDNQKVNQMDAHGINFAQFPQMQPSSQQQQNNVVSSEQSGFTNFSSVQHHQGQIRQQQHYQSLGQPQTLQAHGAEMTNQQGDINAGHSPQQPQIQSQDEQLDFANFSSMGMQQGQIPQQHQPPHIDQSSFANFSLIHQEQAPKQLNQILGEPQNVHMHGGGVMIYQESFESSSNKLMGSTSQQTSSALQANEANQPEYKFFNDQCLNQQQNGQIGAMNPNAFRSVADDEKCAFDAFEALSPKPTSGLMGDSVACNANDPSSVATVSPLFPFKKEHKVVYNNSDSLRQTTTVTVHDDDELRPHCPMKLADGGDKQTYNSHSSFPNDSNMNGKSFLHSMLGDSSGLTLAVPESITNYSSFSDVDASAMLQETISMLQNLNLQQLMQVQQFVARMGISQAQATHGKAMAQKEDANASLQQFAPKQNAPLVVTNQQKEHLGLAWLRTSTCGVVHQRQNAGIVERVAAGTQTPDPSIIPGNQTYFVSELSMQQYPIGNQQQPIGMGVVSSGINIPAVPMGGVPPTAAAPVAPPPELPPVEKEGNPFDVY